MQSMMRSMKMAVVLAAAMTAAASAIDYDSRAQAMPDLPQGPFARTPDGAIVAMDKADLLVSVDEGKTWASRPVFSPEQQEKLNLMPRRERVLLTTDKGTLIAAFMNDHEKKWTWSNQTLDAPGAVLPTYAMRSTDGGETWQDIQKLHDEWTGAIRDIIQTSKGRVIFTTMKMLNDPGRHTVMTYCSDDDGKTWKPSNVIDLGGAGNHGGVTEPSLVELTDGTVWMLIRTNWGEFWSAYSYDGGRFWRTLQPSGIEASSAPPLIKRLASGRLMLLWNRPGPDSGKPHKLTGGDGRWSEVPVSNYRGELSLAFSDDDGATWSKPIVLASGERWISYPYAFEAKPGVVWITTMQGNARLKINEADFVSAASAR
jgi:hypothetical protein